MPQDSASRILQRINAVECSGVTRMTLIVPPAPWNSLRHWAHTPSLTMKEISHKASSVSQPPLGDHSLLLELEVYPGMGPPWVQDGEWGTGGRWQWGAGPAAGSPVRWP